MCIKSALLFHLNDYSTQINYYNMFVCVCAFRMGWFLLFEWIHTSQIVRFSHVYERARWNGGAYRVEQIIDRYRIGAKRCNAMQCNDRKQKPHERNKHTIIRIRKIHHKTNEWLKETEGIGRIKCLIYDEVVQTRIKYLHISIIHPWQRWLKLPALQPCSVLHFTLLCYMHLYIIIISLWLGAFVR